MKKLLSLLLALTLLASAAGAVNLYVDMNRIDTDTPPTIVDGRTLVPVRAIFEAIGATVDWDSATSTATGVRGDTTVVIQINNTTAYVNGEAKVLDVPAQLINDRTMVPARFISEAMGCDVTWDGKTETAAVAYQLKGVGLYATPTGERYHYDGSCNGGTYYETSLAEIAGRGLTPCDKCVLTNSGSTPGTAPGSAEGDYAWTTLPMPAGEVPVNVPGWSSNAAPSNNAGTTSNPSGGGNNGGNGNADNFNTYDNEAQQQTEANWVLNTKSMKIHHPMCSQVKKIAPQNYATSNQDVGTLKSQGYTTCGVCWN